MDRVLVAPDKFRGSASARRVADLLADVLGDLGFGTDSAPLADGGEGFLEVFAGPGSHLFFEVVDGPDGRPVEAAYVRDGPLAVVELAEASGLELVGGRNGNDAMTASTRGTGQLVAAAARAVGPGGLVLVGLGGSATTDGGTGFLEALDAAGGLGGTTLVGACDTEATFQDAATVFSPQKGASPTQVRLLEARLEAVAEAFQQRFGIDVRFVPGSGAAGGTGGAILAFGGELRSGYDVVSEHLGLAARMRRAQLVVTGEGCLDRTSLTGKVVGRVVEDARRLGCPVMVIAGQVTEDVRSDPRLEGAEVISLVDLFGHDRSFHDLAGCVRDALIGSKTLADQSAPGGSRKSAMSTRAFGS